MRRLLSILLLTVAAAAVGYEFYYRAAIAPTEHLAHQRDAEIEWLHQEYHLDSAQLDAIRKLDAQYAPQCEQMYHQIADADARAEKMIAVSHQFTPEVDAALKECAHVQEECRRAALRHVYAVAAQMPPREGDRYIKTMRARILEPGASPEYATAHSL